MVSNLLSLTSILLIASCKSIPATETPWVIIPTAPLVMTQTPFNTEIFTETMPAPTATATVTRPTPTPTNNTLPPSPPLHLVFGQRSEPDTLHPLLGSMMGKDIINSALFAVCTRLTPGGTWIPEMCTDVPTLENGGARWVGSGADLHLEVTFKLRKDWKWHDGQPVTAADYMFTWKLALDTGLDSGIGIMVPQRNAWELVQNVSAFDTQTVVIQYHSESSLKAAAAGQGQFSGLEADYQKLKEIFPSGPAASPFYFSLGSPLPEHILGSIPAKAQSDNAYGHQPVGNGAYRFIEWIPGSEVVLGANLDFPLGAPHFQSLTIRFYLSKDEMMADLQKKLLDGITQDAYFNEANVSELDALQKEGYRLVLNPLASLEHVDMNVTRFPFDDIRVRRALADATDKQALVDEMQAGKGTVQDGPLPVFSWAYSETSLARYPYSIDAARALLAEAGWDCSAPVCKKGDQTLSFTLSTTDRPDRKQLANLLKGMWEKAGFSIDLQLIPGQGLYAAGNSPGPLAGGTFQAALYTWMYSEENQDMASWYSCAVIPGPQNNYNGLNFPRWCSAGAEKQIESASHSAELMADTAKLRSALADIQAIWTQDVPVLPLYNGFTPTVIRSDLSVYALVPGMVTLDFWNAWEWNLN